MNRISYKVYKMCPRVRGQLAQLLNELWWRGMIPDEWCSADGVYIPKEGHSESIGQFRPISLLNVEGKIFFSILSRRLTRFVTSNGFIDPSVQKAGIPGYSGCIEHATLIWNSIKQARKEKTDLSVVWLDLANAYGSVPHKAIYAALEHFWVPSKVIEIIKSYYSKFQMRFTTRQYTTAWQPLRVGIPMGCAISPLLFVMAMEMILRSTSHIARGVAMAPNQHLPPILAYMDDLTLVAPSRHEITDALRSLESLFGWCCMKFKPAKCRSLTIRKGATTKDRFTVGGEIIPLVSEQPVKSLGRWYACPLNDRCRSKELEDFVLSSLRAIDGSGLPGKYKVWCYQFGLLPRVLWQLAIYDIPLSPVERMERKVSGHIRKWLGVPRSFATNALYASSFKLTLPVTSLIEEYKACKVRTQAMLQYSRDGAVRNLSPNLDTGKKWDAPAVTDALHERLAMKDIIGATTQGRAGLGVHSFRRFAEAKGRSKWAMLVDEMRSAEEERRVAEATQQNMQGQWMQWESALPRRLTWNNLKSWEHDRLSFLLRSTYDQLPTPANLYRWRLRDSNACAGCGSSVGTLEHILAGCAAHRGMYTWRHDTVLAILKKWLLRALKNEDAHDENESTSGEERKRDERCQDNDERIDPTVVRFVRGRSTPKVKDSSKEISSKDRSQQDASKEKSTPAASQGQIWPPHNALLSALASHGPSARLLDPAGEWQLATDLERLVFPSEVLITTLRPDVVLWSSPLRTVILVELTVPWETNMEVAHERKLSRYDDLVAQCEQKGWRCELFAVEVGARGFVSSTMLSLLRRVGIRGRRCKKALLDLSAAAESGSAWIWGKYVQADYARLSKIR